MNRHRVKVKSKRARWKCVVSSNQKNKKKKRKKRERIGGNFAKSTLKPSGGKRHRRLFVLFRLDAVSKLSCRSSVNRPDLSVVFVDFILQTCTYIYIHTYTFVENIYISTYICVIFSAPAETLLPERYGIVDNDGNKKIKGIRVRTDDARSRERSTR